VAVTLYCATTNPGKLREFRAAASSGIRIEPLPGIEITPPCPETGHTFEENAIEKALHYGARCKGFLFAEDSGLEVAALGEAPGVYSARFAGPQATDEENNSLLLERLKGIDDRRARYVCVIALAQDGRVMQTFRGEVEGRILDRGRGCGGFGYDPLFYFETFGGTFAEITQDQKQTVSHRGRALKSLMAYVQEQLL
jgi:XTP/dITP diphosphohydrolase